MRNSHPKSTIFTNGKIWREDGVFLTSFGIKNGIIIYTDKNQNKYSGADFDRKFDLKGHLVLPGFTDGHVHLVYGALMRKRIDCRDITTPEELKQRIHEYLRKNPDVKWLQGGNLDIGNVFKDIEKQEKNILNGISSHKPLFISNYDYHSGLCNTEALELTELSSNLHKFKKEEIPVNRSGVPIGIVKENAMDYVQQKIPSASINEKADAVYEMITYMHSLGITSVSDITAAENLAVYKRLYESGRLKIRINSYLPFSEIDNLEEHLEYTKEIDPGLFSIKGFKAFYDGALGSETALFNENYKGTNFNGLRTQMAESGQIYELAKKIDSSGKQIMIHAIGDRAVSDVLGICSKLEEENGRKDRRFRIEHAQHIDEADFDSFKRLNVIVSVQPLHLKYDFRVVIEKLSDTLVKRTHNYKNLLERGVIINFGTDFPIADINPLQTIKMAVTRDTGDMIFHAENKIELNECIKAYTVNNAYASFNEKREGAIDTGKYADFVIMEDDLFSIPRGEIGKAKVLITYFKGEEVYSQ
jgi:predicted amidohydrolase YtcJ